MKKKYGNKIFIMPAIDIAQLIKNIEELEIREYFLKLFDLKIFCRRLRGESESIFTTSSL